MGQKSAAVKMMRGNLFTFKSPKMKILSSDNSIFGLVNFREPVFRYFNDQGYDVVLVAPNPVNGEDMARVAPAYAKYIPVQMERTGQNPLGDLMYLWRLFKIYREEKPDYIFHYTIKPNIYGSIAAKLCGIRTSCMVAGLGYAFENKGIKNRIARWLYKVGLKCSEKVLVLNESNVQELIRSGIAKSEQVILLSGGEGLVLGDYVCNGSATADVAFMMVARMLYEKGYSEYVEASAKIRKKYPEVRCCLLGPIDELYPNAVSRDRISRDVESGVVEYLGFTSTPSEIMGEPSVAIVLPSYYHEGFNRALMESCALGRPVITTDFPGCKELVEDGVNGYICKKKDAESLYQAMERYISLSPDERLLMGVEGRRIAEKRLISKMLFIFMKILSEV